MCPRLRATSWLRRKIALSSCWFITSSSRYICLNFSRSAAIPTISMTLWILVRFSMLSNHLEINVLTFGEKIIRSEFTCMMEKNRSNQNWLHVVFHVKIVPPSKFTFKTVYNRESVLNKCYAKYYGTHGNVHFKMWNHENDWLLAEWWCWGNIGKLGADAFQSNI